jgi:hypothetical protein
VRISRSRHLKVNMGHYEHFEFGATVTLDHSDLGLTDEDVAERGIDEVREVLRHKVLEYLNDELRDDIREAAGLTDEEKSFVLANFKLEDEPSHRKPRRSR